MVGANTVGERLVEGIGTDVAQHVDGDALRPRLFEERGRVRALLRHVQAHGVDLEKRALAKAGTVEREVGIRDAGLVVDPDAFDLRGQRGAAGYECGKEKQTRHELHRRAPFR
jgi:hypothetical protein